MYAPYDACICTVPYSEQHELSSRKVDAVLYPHVIFDMFDMKQNPVDPIVSAI